MAASGTWRGQAEMRQKLMAVARLFPKRVGGALRRRGEKIMTSSKRDFVPVDLGALRKSGHVTGPETSPGRITVTLAYGGPAAPYALAVHEHPSRHSPPSWRSGNVSFSPSGHGPKYLERPLMQALSTLDRDLADDIKLDGII